MYIPRYYRVDDRAELVRFMREHSFATLVSVVDGSPFATHIPLRVEERGETVILSGHLAKANPQARTLADGGEALALFQGPHAYVSPSLYDAEQNVPTWNYAAVHAYGTPRVVSAEAAVAASLDAMVATYEPPYLAQWSGLPEKFRRGMMGGIVAFELEAVRLEGKYKLSQNRSRGEQERVAASLAASGDPAAAGVGRMMRRVLDAGDGAGPVP